MSYDLQTRVRYGTKGGNFGSFVGTYVIGESGWKKIPKDIKDHMLEVGDKVTRSLCRDIDSSVDAAQTKLAEAGVRYHTLTAAQRKPFEEMSDEVAVDWAQGLDKRGKPGSEVLKEFKAALQEVRR
jgi:TRAP-type C4-dicarboxylate transport system substrate-binding protein